jgi:hypothetical protein
LKSAAAWLGVRQARLERRHFKLGRRRGGTVCFMPGGLSVGFSFALSTTRTGIGYLENSSFRLYRQRRRC